MDERLHKITGVNGILTVYPDRVEFSDGKTATILVSDIKDAIYENKSIVLSTIAKSYSIKLSPDKKELAIQIVHTIKQMATLGSSAEQNIESPASATSQSTGSEADSSRTKTRVDTIISDSNGDASEAVARLRETSGMSAKEAERVVGDALREDGVETRYGVPLKWHWYLSRIGLPLGLLRLIFDTTTSAFSPLTLVLNVVHMILIIISIPGLITFRKYGYNSIFITYAFSSLINIIAFFLLLSRSLLTPGIIGEVFGSLITAILTCIYYFKRRQIFVK